MTGEFDLLEFEFLWQVKCHHVEFMLGTLTETILEKLYLRVAVIE